MSSGWNFGPNRSWQQLCIYVETLLYLCNWRNKHERERLSDSTTPMFWLSTSVLTRTLYREHQLEFTMAGGIRRKKNNPSKKRDKRLGPIKVVYDIQRWSPVLNLNFLQYDSDGKMIDDRNTEVGAKLNYKDIIRENPRFEAYYRLVYSASILCTRVILISMNFRISKFACSHVDPIASLVSEQFLFSL